MSTVERHTRAKARSRELEVAPSLGRDSVSQRGRDYRGMCSPGSGSFRRQRHRGEVIVVDNGSDDDSGRLAAGAGAFVVHEPERGYGSAYLAGFAAARGQYIVMADADLTYDFAEIPRFVSELEAGADVVIGNRMKNIQPGAMPWHHRYIGNPVLSGFLNLLFRTGVDDAHCGMRALRRDLLPRLDLRTTGMEFASEMVIRAAKEKLDVRQFAIEYHPRAGESKLSSFRDGWRHLRFLLVHSPNYLFILPGALMAAVGGLVELIVISRLGVFGREWDIHALIGGALLAIVGTQIVALGCAPTLTAHISWASKIAGSIGCARASNSSTACFWGGIGARRPRFRRIHRGRVDQPGIWGARLRATRRTRSDAGHRRDPDLLLVVPALDSRLAAATLEVSPSRPPAHDLAKGVGRRPAPASPRARRSFEQWPPGPIARR